MLLRLAAGGFRDMTRIASGHPGIWPDICVANRDAIVAALDDYLGELGQVREIVASGDRDGLLGLLERARVARRNLPVGIPADETLVELRIPVVDREGVLAEVTTLAFQVGVTSATSRSPTRSKVRVVSSWSSSPRPAWGGREVIFSRRGAAAYLLTWPARPRSQGFERAPSSTRIAPAPGPAARPRRQGDLPPGAAVRGARVGSIDDPGDRRW